MESKVSKEVALEELKNFINKFVKKPVELNELEESYPDVLQGIMDGFVVFNEEMVPTYTLKHPIKDEKGDPAVTVINFKTRIKPSTAADIGKGLEIKKEVLLFQLKCTAYITGQTIGMLDKFEPYDYDAIYQISTVFS